MIHPRVTRYVYALRSRTRATFPSVTERLSVVMAALPRRRARHRAPRVTPFSFRLSLSFSLFFLVTSSLSRVRALRNSLYVALVTRRPVGDRELLVASTLRRPSLVPHSRRDRSPLALPSVSLFLSFLLFSTRANRRTLLLHPVDDRFASFGRSRQTSAPT